MIRSTIEFGHGTILVSAGLTPEKENEKAVGILRLSELSESDAYKSTEEIEQVVPKQRADIRFNDIRSIDIVMEALQGLKLELLKLPEFEEEDTDGTWDNDLVYRLQFELAF